MVENLNKKQFLTYDEQITFLEKQKGLIISDKEYARKTLLKIGYFPLINAIKRSLKSQPTINSKEEQHLKIFMSCIALIMI